MTLTPVGKAAPGQAAEDAVTATLAQRPPSPARTEQAEAGRGAAVNPEAVKAAQILNAIRGLPESIAVRTVTRDENDDARKIFRLNPNMDRQAVVVTLANEVGFRALQQAYLTLTGRQLTTDFRAELASPDASRAGFGLSGDDQARLTNLMLDDHTDHRWIVGNKVVDSVGKADRFGANLFQGSTRQLAQPGLRLPPAVKALIDKTVGDRTAKKVASMLLGGMEGARLRLIDDPEVIDALITEIEDARREGQLDGFLRAFEQQRGKSIYAYLGEVVRDPALRQRALKHLPQPISNAQLTYDAFLENIALSMAYSDAPGAALEGKIPDAGPHKRGGSSSKLLKYFGYQASDVYAGKWGFEMRVFTPIPGKAKYKDVIVAFRGTQGISFDLAGNRPGTLDTQVADFAPQGVGYNQLQHNEAMVRHVIGQAAKKGPLVMTGHSLGGALAQLAAVWFREDTRRVVTFQGANIDQADVDRVRAHNRTTTQPMQATHYRVDGDLVPTAGEAMIPGMIHYFDADWKLKPQSFRDTLMSNLRPVQRASLGHIVPMLTMYLQGLDVPKDQTGLKLLQKDGIRDEQQVQNGAEVRVTYAGKYNATRSAAQDPRLRLEEGRDNLSGLISGLSSRGIHLPTVSYTAIFEHELPYNTLLAHLEKAALAAKDYKDFEKRALKVMGLQDGKDGTVSLEVMDKDRELGESLGQDVPTRVDVKGEHIDDIVPRDELNAKEFRTLKSLWSGFR